MTDIIDRVSILSTIDKKHLLKLCEKVELCICDDVYNSNLDGNYKCWYDIGIGSLGIDFSSGDSVKYKFIPSKEFEKEITSTLLNNENPLKNKIDQSLVKKITDTYKDFF